MRGTAARSFLNSNTPAGGWHALREGLVRQIGVQRDRHPERVQQPVNRLPDRHVIPEQRGAARDQPGSYGGHAMIAASQEQHRAAVHDHGAARRVG